MVAPRSLVTGGAGFIGSHLVRHLLDRGEAVRVLDIANASHLPSEVEIIQGSILDPDTVREALQGVRHLYHLAANPNLWAPRKSDFAEINLRGTETVLEAATKADLDRIIHTSTESILKGCGCRAEKPTIDETVALTEDDMPGPYCRSKFLAERRALAAAHERGLPVVVVNPTLPVGPGDRLVTPPTRMLMHFLTGNSRFFLDCTLNMVDVRDAAFGHILAAEKGRIGERYILSGTNLPMRDLLSMLGKLTGRAMPDIPIPYWMALIVGAVSEFIADHITHRLPMAPLTGVRLTRGAMAFDNAKAVTELGFRPGPIEDALRDAIGWLKNEGLIGQAPLALAKGAPVGQD